MAVVLLQLMNLIDDAKEHEGSFFRLREATIRQELGCCDRHVDHMAFIVAAYLERAEIPLLDCALEGIVEFSPPPLDPIRKGRANDLGLVLPKVRLMLIFLKSFSTLHLALLLEERGCSCELFIAI